MAEIEELDLVALRKDMPEFGLRVGDVGTAVLVHGAGEAYEVEVSDEEGCATMVEPLYVADVERVPAETPLYRRRALVPKSAWRDAEEEAWIGTLIGPAE